MDESLGRAGYAALEALFRVLPERFGSRFARVVGSIYRPPRMRKRALRMMKAVLGSESRPETQWRTLWQEHVRWVGRVTIDYFYWARLPVDELRSRVLVKGREHLAEALDSGRGAVLLANHLGNFISVTIHPGAWAPDVCIYGNRLPNRLMEKRFAAFHQRLNATRLVVGEGLPFRALRTLRHNGIVVSVADLTAVEKQNAWVRFGNAETLVNVGPALLALRSGARVLPLSFTPVDDTRHEITIHPSMPLPQSGDPAADALQVIQQAVDRVVEDLVERPEQWWQWNAAPYRV